MSSRLNGIPKFVDFLQLEIKGGTGGQGLPKFGGFGGDGGHVTITAKYKIKSLRQLALKYPKQKCKAGTGDNSHKFHLYGKKGDDLNLDVPIGVLVHLGKGQVVDLNKDGDSVTVAKGGSGGNPDTNFLGLRGEGKLVGLELKLLADVGLVGFPNAGKSTFLSVVSKSKPKIAAYPFTTITPQLGMIQYDDGRRISIADLPGLIEGAHQNFGKGIKFLRHIERTKILLYVLDVNSFQLSEKYPERSALETLLLLMQELTLYGQGLIEKPAILVINKCDTDPKGDGVSDLLEKIKDLPESMKSVNENLCPEKCAKFDDIICISAQTRNNVDIVQERLREVMDTYTERRLEEESQKKLALLLNSEDKQQTKNFV